MRRGQRAAWCLLALAWAWWVSGLRPFHPTTTVAIELPALLLGWRLARHPRTAGRAAPRSGAGWPWVALLAAAGAREVIALLAHDRRRYPSLSRVLDGLLASHPERFALVLGWLLLGTALVMSRSEARDRG